MTVITIACVCGGIVEFSIIGIVLAAGAIVTKVINKINGNR